MFKDVQYEYLTYNVLNTNKRERRGYALKRTKLTYRVLNILSKYTREIGECEREEGEGEERERGGRGVSEMRRCLKILVKRREIPGGVAK